MIDEAPGAGRRLRRPAHRACAPPGGARAKAIYPRTAEGRPYLARAVRRSQALAGLVAAWGLHQGTGNIALAASSMIWAWRSGPAASIGPWGYRTSRERRASV